MAAHLPLGFIGIVGGDGLVNRGMRLIRPAVLTRIAQGHLALLPKPFDDGGVDCGKDRIIGNNRQRVVKRNVGLAEPTGITYRLPIRRECDGKFLEIVLGGALSGEAGEPNFEKSARLLKMLDAAWGREKVAGGARQSLAHRLRCRFGDPGALARAKLHQPHPIEVKQSLANGRPTDAEFAHQLPLGRQMTAWRDLGIANALLDSFGNIFKQLTAADGGHESGIPVIPEKVTVFGATGGVKPERTVSQDNVCGESIRN